MSKKKRIVLGFLIFLLLASAFYVVYKIDGTRSFSEIVDSGNLSNLRLTIYFMYLDKLTPWPSSIDELKSFRCDRRIVVRSGALEKHIDLLEKLNEVQLIPHKSNYLDCRIYYVFTTKLGHKLYDVAMWSSNESVDVNGVTVKDSDIFYDVILPFLPQDAANQLRMVVADMRHQTLEQNG